MGLFDFWSENPIQFWVALIWLSVIWIATANVIRDCVTGKNSNDGKES